MTYFAHCFIDPSKLDHIKELRDKHLSYIKVFGSNIVYGGVCGTEDVPYQSICFFMKVDTENEALSFVRKDPYFPAYSQIDMSEFSQKIPKVGVLR